MSICPPVKGFPYFGSYVRTESFIRCGGWTIVWHWGKGPGCRFYEARCLVK